MHQQIPGHLYGPPAPHIAFWYGSEYLGEVRGHPSNVDEAVGKMRRSIEILNPGPEGSALLGKLGNSGSVVYCGAISAPTGRRST